MGIGRGAAGNGRERALYLQVDDQVFVKQQAGLGQRMVVGRRATEEECCNGHEKPQRTAAVHRSVL